MRWPNAEVAVRQLAPRYPDILEFVRNEGHTPSTSASDCAYIYALPDPREPDPLKTIRYIGLTVRTRAPSSLRIPLQAEH